MGTHVTLLLDTAVLIWALGAPERLTVAARTALDDDSQELWVSAASAWEITTKHRLGRLERVRPLIDDWDGQLDRFGLAPLDISHRHALRAGAYDVAHADPFDRMIAAQAELEGMTLVSNDRAFRSFPVAMLW